MKTDRPTADQDPPAEELGIVDALVQLSFLVHSVLGKVAAEHELSLVQVRLLGVLRDRQPSMMQLAAHLGLDKSSVTGLVDRAERRGLVRRASAEDDRRAVHVALTGRGRALADTFTRQMSSEMAAITEGLGEAARARLAGLASQVVDHARRRKR